jgi:hypothetical protein
MTRSGKLAVITALMLVCGSPAATAQTYGATGPARADTTDPNSAPMRGWRQPGFTSELQAYARGPRSYRSSRAAARARAAKPDPVLAANQSTALLMRDAINPWAATSSAPAKRR